MNSKRLLILNGSPRKKGTSYSFARTIKGLAEEMGNTAEIIHIIEYLEEGKSFDELKGILSKSDILSLISPLYVDSLPYPVIWFFEKLAVECKNELRGKHFFAIGQCAFPYIKMLEPLLGSCRCFAEAVEMKWLGGLGYGGGVMIDGAPIENLGKKGEKIILAFKLALKDVFQENIISPKSQELLTMELPKIFSKPVAVFLNYKTRRIARKNGVTDLKRKFYVE